MERPHQHHRHGESGRIPARTERFFQYGDEWYFSIRRGVDQGPYPSMEEAHRALNDFIDEEITFEATLAFAGAVYR